MTKFLTKISLLVATIGTWYQASGCYRGHEPIRSRMNNGEPCMRCFNCLLVKPGTMFGIVLLSLFVHIGALEAQTVGQTINLEHYLADVPKPYKLYDVQVDSDGQMELLAVSLADFAPPTFYVIDICSTGVAVGEGFPIAAEPGAWLSSTGLAKGSTGLDYIRRMDYFVQWLPFVEEYHMTPIALESPCP